MSDLISRQAAIDAVKNHIMPTKEGFYEPCEVFEALNEVPSVQPETGRWIHVDDSGAAVRFFKCSRCGYLVMRSGRKYCEDCGSYNGGGS